MSNILPFEIVSTLTVNRFEIDSIDIRLFTSAIIRVNLFDSNGFRVSVKNVFMQGEDYANWGNDDQYIITFVMNSLGFTPKPPVIEEPTVAVEEVTVVEEPSAVVEEPSAVVVEPTVVVEEPTAVVVEPTVVVEEPTAVVVEPTVAVEEDKNPLI
jgi:hypothetical protein